MREANQRLATADPRLYNIELEDADADADADAGESEGESESKGALPSGRVIEMVSATSWTSMDLVAFGCRPLDWVSVMKIRKRRGRMS